MGIDHRVLHTWYPRRITDLLLIVEDRHAERALEQSLASARAGGASVAVLTGDALLAMRLRREAPVENVAPGAPGEIDARLTTDSLTPETILEHDRVMLDGVARATGRYAEVLGTNFGPYLQYTLIPSFSRAVRNVIAIDEELRRRTPERLVLIGGGPLVDAARLIAARRGLRTETVAGDVFSRASQALARLKAARATKWVNTEFRALVLEPGFIWLMFLKGWWRHVTGTPASMAGRALIVAGDRFTADVVERLQGEQRPIVLAGATQPGRALFASRPFVELETFTDLTAPLRWMSAVIDAFAKAIALAGDRAHGGQFTVAGVPYWPLVGRTVWLHLPAWIPALRCLQSLTARAAHACPGADVLMPTDVTAYNRVVIDTARHFGIPSTGIQHGITGEPNGHSIVHVDRLATWGEQAESWYREHAAQAATFVVTGNPRFDALAARLSSHQPPATSHALPASSPQPPAPFTITICTGFMTDYSLGASELENLLMIDVVVAWAKSRTGVRVIHKMHPGEELEYYQAAARTLAWDPLVLTTIQEPILYDLIEKSDVLVAAYSTTVLEALLLGAPAIVFDAVFRRRLLPLDRVPGVTVAYSAEELEQQLAARLAAPAIDRPALGRSDELRRYVSAVDGRATQRVAALLAPGP